MTETAGIVARLRSILPLVTVILLSVVAYDGWVFYSRWSYSRHAERTRQEQEAAAARRTLDALGGGGLKILSFYATPGTIQRGGHATLCYSVTGAQSVRTEPKLEELHPALTYCLQVSPAKDTEYKLIAEDAAGHATTATVTIQVPR